MAIVYDGKVVRLQVKPGREGMEDFQRQVRQAFNLGEDVELDCVFDCRAPGTGEKIKLRGLESYSAAMHCAAVAAGERLAKMASPAAPAAASPPGSAPGTGQLPGMPADATGPASATSSSRSLDSTMHVVGGGGSIGHCPTPTATATAHPSSSHRQSPEGAAAGAPCRSPSLTSPGGEEECGPCGPGAGGSGAASPASGPSRRRNLLSGLFKSLASAKRIC